jgi:hypothetical protein
MRHAKNRDEKAEQARRRALDDEDEDEIIPNPLLPLTTSSDPNTPLGRPIIQSNQDDILLMYDDDTPTKQLKNDESGRGEKDDTTMEEVEEEGEEGEEKETESQRQARQMAMDGDEGEEGEETEEKEEGEMEMT